MKPLKAAERYIALLEKQKTLAEEIEIARGAAMTEMQKVGLKQLKTQTHTVTIAKRVTEQVDEMGFRQWAGNTPGVELDLFYVNLLDKKRVVDFAKKQLNETGEIVPFIKANETEYISIRAAK